MAYYGYFPDILVNEVYNGEKNFFSISFGCNAVFFLTTLLLL